MVARRRRGVLVHLRGVRLPGPSTGTTGGHAHAGWHAARPARTTGTTRSAHRVGRWWPHAAVATGRHPGTHWLPSRVVHARVHRVHSAGTWLPADKITVTLPRGVHVVGTHQTLTGNASGRIKVDLLGHSDTGPWATWISWRHERLVLHHLPMRGRWLRMWGRLRHWLLRGRGSHVRIRKEAGRPRRHRSARHSIIRRHLVKWTGCRRIIIVERLRFT